MRPLKENWESFLSFLRSTRLVGTTLDNFLLKSFYAVVLIGMIVLLLPSERPFEYSNLTIGSISPEEIIAPFKFAIQKTPEELEKERQAARASVPPLFDKQPDIANIQEITLNKFFSDIDKFFETVSLNATPEGYTTPENIQARVDSFLQQIAVNYRIVLPQPAFVELYTVYKKKQLQAFQGLLNQGLSAVYSRGIIDRPKSEIKRETSNNNVTIVENGVEETFSIDEVLEVSEAQNYLLSMLMKQFGEQSPQLTVAKYLLASFIRPNLKYNEKLTIERKEQAVHDVPLTRGYVEQDERIIDSNEKVTPEIYQKLVSLSLALKERSAWKGGLQQLKFQAGKFLFAIILLIFTVLYIYFYRRSIFTNNSFLGMITIILVMQLSLDALIIDVLHWSELTIPVVLAPMLLAILLDFGIAFICTITLSLVLGAALGNDFTFAFMSLIVGSVGIYSVQKIRNRGDMFRAILFVLTAYFVVNSIVGMLHFATLKTIITDFTYYMLLSAIVAPIVVFFMVNIFERFFDVTTDITLLELSDLNHPLLKQLSVKAPGTFHHSIVVANLAESAALAIGANALLTRVGCYFHDIGKMNKPEYFVENQMGGVNKHEGVSPYMSSLILANHVKEGIKLAEKYRLPHAVTKFIPEHHGTGLMTFFYHKALNTSDEKEINEGDFRYPGPKPQSKETAIAMLSDTVEAASRALQNPTPQRIRNLVDTLVDKKIEEGQLDESNLTFLDIKRIKEAFVPILTGIHHVRIEYPTDADKEKPAQPVPTNSKKSGMEQPVQSAALQTKGKHGS